MPSSVKRFHMYAPVVIGSYVGTSGRAGGRTGSIVTS